MWAQRYRSRRSWVAPFPRVAQWLYNQGAHLDRTEGTPCAPVVSPLNCLSSHWLVRLFCVDAVPKWEGEGETEPAVANRAKTTSAVLVPPASGAQRTANGRPSRHARIRRAWRPQGPHGVDAKRITIVQPGRASGVIVRLSTAITVNWMVMRPTSIAVVAVRLAVPRVDHAGTTEIVRVRVVAKESVLQTHQMQSAFVPIASSPAPPVNNVLTPAILLRTVADVWPGRVKVIQQAHTERDSVQQWRTSL
jgi:hypothetical protein